MFTSSLPASPRIRAGRALAGLALSASLGFLLVGCSGASDAPTKSDDSTSASSSDQSTQETDKGSSETSAGSSATTVSVDGSVIELSDATTVCHEEGGTVTLAVGAMGGTDAIGAVLTGGDSPKVTSVALGSVDGTSMGWAEGAPGEAKATKDGNTYTISGSMMAVDAANPTTPAEKPFEMQIVCP